MPEEDSRANDRRMGLTEGARRKGPGQQARRRAAGPHSQPPFLCPGNWPWDWCSVIVFHQQTHRYLSVILQEPWICKREATCHLLENIESPKPPAGSLGLPNLSSVLTEKGPYSLLSVLPCARYWGPEANTKRCSPLSVLHDLFCLST